MSLSISTLTAIQKVGAAAFSADEKLKTEVREYAERVNTAITKTPYNLGNDTLIEHWKVVARLSQTLAGIEEELKNVYQVASKLTDDDQPRVHQVLALAAPKRSAQKKAASPADLTPTDVLAKPKKKSAAPKAKVSQRALAGAPGRTSAPGGNAAKLLAYLESTLNATEFSGINQTAVGKSTGIALGSMTAAIKKLLETGCIIAGPTGSYKLAEPQPAATAL